MAGKEATLVLLDVGSSMNKQYQGSKNKLRRIDLAIDCIKLMVQNKIFNYKSHEVGLILFGAEEAPDGCTLYIQEINKPDLDFVRNISELGNHEESQLKGGDIFDALDKAVHTLDEYVGTKKIEKKIFVLTAGYGRSDYNEKQISKLIRSIEKVNVKVNFIALDFMNEYDANYDDPEKPDLLEVLNNKMLTANYESQEQTVNSRYVFLMVQELRNHMRIFPANVAFELYSQFHTKNMSARASFRGEFMINDENSIQVLIYKRTAEEKLPGMKKHSTIGDFSKDPQRNGIRNDSVFYIEDDPTMTPVDKENMIKGYSYGRQIVPIDSIMEEKLKYQCPRSFQLLGFVERNTIPRHYFMSSVDMVIAVESEKAQKTLSSLITALIATKKVAIARFVGRERGSPKLMVLIPHKSDTYECFWMMALPTAEDIRHFQFASLKRSTPQQQHAVGQLIDSMDLENIPGEDGRPEEILKMKYIANPTKQYFQQVAMHRAITMTDVMPEISPIILEYLHPERRVYNLARDAIQKIKNAFKFKKNEIKKAQEKKLFWKQLFEQEQSTVEIQHQQEEEVVEINQEEEEMVQMLSKQKYGFNDDIIKEIGTVDPIADFKKMITEKRMDLVDSALSQMQKMIVRLVDESVKGSYYEKALECLLEMRKASISEDEPDNFNKFLVLLKDRYNQTVFWAQVVKEGTTLISMIENSTSTITVDQAQEFLNLEDNKNKMLVDQLQEEQEDLLADIE